MPAPLRICDLGCRDFLQVREVQERLVALRRAGGIPDTLLFCSHPPVVTAGRAAEEAEIAAARAALTPAGIALHRCERGGRLTYHGPGQVVMYPILRLAGAERDLHAFQRGLEGSAREALAEIGVAASRREGHPGLWVGAAKLASIGIAVRGWVTWHGLALNVEGDLSPFRLFQPCGIAGLQVTSLEQLIGHAPERMWLQERLGEAFCCRFGREAMVVSGEAWEQEEVALR